MAARSSPPQNLRLLASALVLLRLFVGVKFLLAGAQKWDWIGTHRLAHTLTAWAAANAFPAYARFLTQTVLPQEALFTYLVVLGEVGVGALLLLGLCTRLAALLALVMSANYLLATWHLGPVTQGYNESFLVMELAFLLTGAGRTAGLDARLARKHPGWILW
jgi:uncharacterized membrane protein YphA (DoxX/SURF4 family)